jgi:hypothetical protein
MKCNVIRDLLPSYIDGICSEETIAEVNIHTATCEECKKVMQLMQQPAEQTIETNFEEAIEPFKLIKKNRRLKVIIACLMTFMITIVGSLVVQEVGVVHQFFFPKISGIVNIAGDSNEWHGISFSSDGITSQDYVLYDSLFLTKKVINDANSDNEVWLRVKDEQGNIIIDEFQISSGTGKELKKLKRNKKYFFEIKAPDGWYCINAV